MRMSLSPREARRRAGRDDALGRFGAGAARALTFMYSLTPAQSGNPGIRSWQKSTNAWFAAMTTGVVGHSVSSRSNVMTSTSDPRGDADAEAARVRREERHRARRDDDDARAALAGALSVAAMARGEVCRGIPFFPNRPILAPILHRKSVRPAHSAPLLGERCRSAPRRAPRRGPPLCVDPRDATIVPPSREPGPRA